MIVNTFVTAFLAASLMVCSCASPCKVSSRTIDTSTTVGVTSTFAEVPGTTESVASTTGVSSFEDTTLTISQSETSTEASAISKDITTAVLTTDLNPIAIETGTESSTVPEDITTTAIPTTSAESITVVKETTTTTSEATVFTGFLVNSGFDDTDTVQPWGHSPRAFTSFSIDSNTKHDGRHSARLTSSRLGKFWHRSGAGRTNPSRRKLPWNCLDPSRNWM